MPQNAITQISGKGKNPNNIVIPAPESFRGATKCNLIFNYGFLFRTIPGQARNDI